MLKVLGTVLIAIGLTGSPNAQTKATAKYQARAGYASKSYKLKVEVAEAFKEACAKKGVSQASKITELMLVFIEETKEE